MDRFTAILNIPFAYLFFQRMVGAEFSRTTYLNQYAKPVAAEKILDLGCGPADILKYLPPVNYTGLDISPEYIRSAQKQFGSQGRFLCGDVGLATIEGEQSTFDLVLSVGVIHHLNDAQATKLFELARQALGSTGRLVTYDGCFTAKQSRIARWLLARDRGKFVRTREEYLRLASPHFSNVETHLRDDLLRIPYTHLIMCCRL